MRFLERLNRPAAAVLALSLLLAVGGFLFFQQVNQTTVGAPATPAGESFSTEQGTTTERTSVGSEDATTEETAASSETMAERYADGLGPFSPRRSGMEQRLQECNEARAQEECIKTLVADAAPRAGYIGARTELNKDGSGRNEKVLYYEDPDLKSCEYTRKEFDSGSGDTYYAVIIAGEGAFGDQASEECVIEF